MTRKSNRSKTRSTRTTSRTLAEVLEEEANQRPQRPLQQEQQPQPQQQQQHVSQRQGLPQPRQQQVLPQPQQRVQPQHWPQLPRLPLQQRQHHVRLEQILNEIQQQQQNVIQEHEVEVQEVERYFHLRPPIGTESLRAVEEVRQYSHRRHARDGQVIRRCQEFLQQLIDLKSLLRQVHLDREERVILRQRRHLVQSQLHALLDSILQLNQLYYLKLEEYLDRVLYQVLQYASNMDRDNEEMQQWIHSIRSDPNVMDSMTRYNNKQRVPHEETLYYRTSPGRVRPLTSNSDW